MSKFEGAPQSEPEKVDSKELPIKNQTDFSSNTINLKKTEAADKEQEAPQIAKLEENFDLMSFTSTGESINLARNDDQPEFDTDKVKNALRQISDETPSRITDFTSIVTTNEKEKYSNVMSIEPISEDDLKAKGFTKIEKTEHLPAEEGENDDQLYVYLLKETLNRLGVNLKKTADIVNGQRGNVSIDEAQQNLEAISAHIISNFKVTKKEDGSYDVSLNIWEKQKNPSSAAAA
jgi:hypothetical protein